MAQIQEAEWGVLPRILGSTGKCFWVNTQLKSQEGRCLSKVRGIQNWWKRRDNWIEVQLQNQLHMWAWDLSYKIFCCSLPQVGWPTQLLGEEFSTYYVNYVELKTAKGGLWLLSCVLPKFTLQSWSHINLATECFPDRQLSTEFRSVKLSSAEENCLTLPDQPQPPK